MNALTTTMLAPNADASYLTRLGTNYRSDGSGVIHDVPLGTEVTDLQSSGCRLVQPGRYPLFSVKKVDVTNADEQTISSAVVGTATQYTLDKAYITNGSADLNGLALEIWSEPGKKGTQIAQFLFGQAFNDPTKLVELDLSLQNWLTGNLYLTVTTPLGGPGTFDVFLYGDVIS